MGRALDCMVSAMTVSALKVSNDFTKYNAGRSVTILTSTHMGPYGLKNFPQKTFLLSFDTQYWQFIGLFTIEGDIKTNKAFKKFFFELVQECLPAQGN